jgi:photosystem II stability/assembly factor-like uncharacterized protein
MRAVLVGLALVLATAGVARANGRFPATVDVHFKPGDHQVMALQVTWGVIFTEDGGATWHWICEDAVGFGGVYDPDYTFDAEGNFYATTTSTRGLASTHDHCVWNPAPAPLGGDPATFVSHIELGPDDKIYALASTMQDTQMYTSSDQLTSDGAISNPGNGVSWWESMVAAPTALPSGETRLYISSYTYVPIPNTAEFFKKRRMFRSDDSGQTWTELSTQVFHFTHANLPDLQFIAVSPLDPDLVFAKVKKVNGLGIGDDIWRSDDAGVTWTKVFSSGDDVTALVPRLNGQVILAERLTGIHFSTDGGQTFGASTPDSPEVDCMRERDDGLLFLCGKDFEPANMALGTSSDGITWTSILTYKDIDDAYPGCPSGTDQHDVCYSNRWCCIVHQFGIPDDSCADECLGVVDAGPGVDGGTGGGGGGGCCKGNKGSPDSAVVMGFVVVVPLGRRRSGRRRG